MVVLRIDDGLIVLVNEAFGRLLGFSTDQLVGRASAEFGLWPSRVEREQLLLIAAAGGPRPTLETQLHTGGGRLIEVEISADRVKINGAAHSFAIIRDVTAREVAERALQASEERFRALVASSRDPILVTDATGVLTYCSPGVDYLLGYRAEDLVGTAERDLIHPEDLRIRDALMTRLLTGSRMCASIASSLTTVGCSKRTVRSTPPARTRPSGRCCNERNQAPSRPLAGAHLQLVSNADDPDRGVAVLT